MTQSGLLPEHTEKLQKAVTMSTFIMLAEKARRGGGRRVNSFYKLKLWLFIMSHFIICLTALSHWNLCWASCWEILMPSRAFPAQPGTEHLWGSNTNPQRDCSHGAKTGQWGLSRALAQPRSLQTMLTRPTDCFKGVRVLRSGARAAPSRAGTSQNQKKEKRMEPPTQPISPMIVPARPLPHLLVRDNSKSASVVSMKEKWK